MISQRAFTAIALSLGFAGAQIGCLALSDKGVDGTHSVGIETLNGNTNGGTNGASSVDVADTMEQIWSSGDAPFDADNEDLIKIQTASVGTRNVLSYIIACALPLGSYTINGITYDGGAILTSTSSWTTSALSTQAKYDLVACVMAHVNPFNQQIDLRFSGDGVADVLPAATVSEFSTPEALWVVYETAVDGLVREVWPIPATAGQCAYSADDVEFRICGDIESQERCGTTVKNDFANHCSQSVVTGNWSCDGHSAIKTWLRTADVDNMYPGCAP